MVSLLKGTGRWFGFGIGLMAGALGWLATESSALARAGTIATAPMPAIKPTPPAPQSREKKLGPPPDIQTSAKVNAYIEVLNEGSEPMFSERDCWYKAIDPKVGPTGKESKPGEWCKQLKETFPLRFFLIESIPKVKRDSEELLAIMGQKLDKKQQERVERQWEAVVTVYSDVIGYMNQIHFEDKQK